MSDAGPATRPRLAWRDGVLVLAIALVVMSPVLFTGYSPLDDFEMLRDNPRYIAPSLHGLGAHWAEPDFRIFAPLTYSIWHVLAYAVDVRTEVWPFKIASLVAHAFASLAAWWALAQLVPRGDGVSTGPAASRAARFAAVIGALVVAVHPAQVESIAWTTGLKDVLVGGLMFATLGAYLRYLESPRRGAWRLALGLAVLAMLAKPTAMVLPLMLLALHWHKRRNWREAVRRVWPFFVPAVGVGLIMLKLQGGGDVPRIDPWLRPLIALDALSFYLAKIVFPVALVPDYGRSPSFVMSSGAMLWTWAPAALLAGVVARYGSRHLKLAGLLFVIPLLPVLGLVPFDMQQYSTVADHYLYPAMLGVGLAVALLLLYLTRSCEESARSEWMRRSATIIPRMTVRLMLAACAALAVVQALRWRDQSVLWERTVVTTPHSFLARGLLSNLAIDRGDLELAEQHAAAAVELQPRAMALANLASIQFQRGEISQAAGNAGRALDLGLANPRSLAIMYRQAQQAGRDDLAQRVLDRRKSLP